MREISIDETQIARPCTGEHAAREHGVHSGAQLDGGVAVVDSLGSPGQRYLICKGADNAPHGGKRHGGHALLIRHAELIGYQDAVNPSGLQGI